MIYQQPYTYQDGRRQKTGTKTGTNDDKGRNKQIGNETPIIPIKILQREPVWKSCRVKAKENI